MLFRSEFAFFFRRESAEFTPDPNFVPFFWRRKGDDPDGNGGASDKGLEDSMGPSGQQGSQISNMEVDANANHGKTVAANDSSNVQRVMAITPYNSNPQTPWGIAIVERIRRSSPGLVRVAPAAVLHGSAGTSLQTAGMDVGWLANNLTAAASPLLVERT